MEVLKLINNFKNIKAIQNINSVLCFSLYITTKTINYGKIEKDSNGERIFIFTNVGDEPLIIQRIQSSCGCTVPKKPEKPIMPGEKGEIKVSYATNRVGGFST